MTGRHSTQGQNISCSPQNYNCSQEWMKYRNLALFSGVGRLC